VLRTEEIKQTPLKMDKKQKKKVHSKRGFINPVHEKKWTIKIISL
jgi:hypothetical protein